MHSPEQNRKKMEARVESMHHMEKSAVDGPHHDMQTHEHMYTAHDMNGGADMAAKYRGEASREQESQRRKVYAED